MTTLFGFILFCCVAWWWVRGHAFAAFVVTMGLIFLLGAGGWFEPYPYDPNAPARLAWEGLGTAVVIGFAPWLIRSQILWTRSKRIARAGEQVWSQPTSYPRIPR